MSWLECLNQAANEYAPLLDGLDKLIGIAVSAGLFWLAYRANGIAKEERKSRQYQISHDDRQLFQSVFSKIQEAMTQFYREGIVAEEARSLFWQARGEATLNLPKDVEDYVEGLYKDIMELYRLDKFKLRTSEEGGLPVGDARNAAAKRKEELMNKLMEEKPHNIFAPYMKVKV